MLSGALLFQPAKLNEPMRVFFKKRLNRIGLPFAFWSAVYLAWAFYLSGLPVTIDNIVQGMLSTIFNGAYYHFWFIYLIIGLYLITPILRVIIAYGNSKILQYLVVLWFVSVAVVPLVQLGSGYTLNNTIFVIGGWVGYFVLGTYLQRTKLRSFVLYGLLILSFVWTILGTWLMNYPLESLGQNYLFLIT
jgi:surface polysaccharide O-acyltransferase-like enzyme